MQVHSQEISASLTLSASAALIDAISNPLSDSTMTNDEIRRENLRILVSETGGVAKLADRLGISGSQVSQWKNASPDSKTGKPRAMQDESARRLENACGKPRGWMDQQHSIDTAEPMVYPLRNEVLSPSTNIHRTEDSAQSTIQKISAKWPFPLVDESAYLALPPDGRNWVQAKTSAAIEEARSLFATTATKRPA
jgi:hypothetical protein